MSADAVSSVWIAADWPAAANISAGSSTRGTDLDDLFADVGSEPRWLHQVHGATVVDSSEVAFEKGPPEADGIISSRRGEVIAIRTADCLPVQLCSVAGDEVAAVHCGWRSLAAGILANTIEKMRTPATDLLAWFGPAISQAAFEVQDDVRDAFISVDEQAASCFESNERGRWQADLYALARQKLAKSGVTQIYGGGLCTYSDAERFYSYRRDGTRRRMISFIIMMANRSG